jgi:hypothetical protein
MTTVSRAANTAGVCGCAVVLYGGGMVLWWYAMRWLLALILRWF